MEDKPQMKREEQYPLLKVEGGAGDNKYPQNSTTVVTTGWTVSCLPKQSWCHRWPEYLSACWMTLILMAISFLIFYAIGISAYRRQPIVLMRCNDTKQGSNVYYHYIIPQGANVPFRVFSEYLTFMAVQYPSLHFYVFFLMDDSGQLEGAKHSKFFNRLIIPQISYTVNSMLDQNYKREIREFQRKYQNVNVSVMDLSKYMAITPLRYKWKTVPLSYLPFYARIYEIWQNGGIGLDLITFNNRYNMKKRIDRRVNAILRQHSDGMDIAKYAEVLDSLDKEDENEFFSIFLNFINSVINETSIFLNTEYTTDIKTLDNSPEIQTHRAKREFKNEEIIKHVSTNYNITNNLDNNRTMSNYSSTPVFDNGKPSNNYTEVITFFTQDSNNATNTKAVLNTTEEIKKKKTEIMESANDLPQVLLFYDISGYIDNKIPMGPKKKPEILNNFNILSSLLPGQKNIHKNYVTISPEGNFVAASSPQHPFLFQLFSAGCQRTNPIFAIKDLLWRQCSGFMRNDSYCMSIRMLYL